MGVKDEVCDDVLLRTNREKLVYSAGLAKGLKTGILSTYVLLILVIAFFCIVLQYWVSS
jgi:hypothetical protein